MNTKEEFELAGVSLKTISKEYAIKNNEILQWIRESYILSPDEFKSVDIVYNKEAKSFYLWINHKTKVTRLEIKYPICIEFSLKDKKHRIYLLKYKIFDDEIRVIKETSAITNTNLFESIALNSLHLEVSKLTQRHLQKQLYIYNYFEFLQLYLLSIVFGIWNILPFNNKHYVAQDEFQYLLAKKEALKLLIKFTKRNLAQGKR